MAQPERYVFSVEVTVENDRCDIEEVKKTVLRMLSTTPQIFFSSDRRSVKIEKIDTAEIHQEGITRSQYNGNVHNLSTKVKCLVFRKH
jgi:hypothetical protein